MPNSIHYLINLDYKPNGFADLLTPQEIECAHNELRTKYLQWQNGLTEILIYKPNWVILHYQRKTYDTQSWQVELIIHMQKRMPKCLPLWEEYKPLYMRFTNAQARKVANSIYPANASLAAVTATMLGIFNNISNPFWWVGLVSTFPMIAVNSYSFIRWLIGNKQVKNYEAEIVAGAYTEEFDGSLGAGKTATLLSDGKISADARGAETRSEVKHLQVYTKSEIAHFPTKEREDAEERIKAEEFYKDSGTYPYLWTTTPAFVDGIPTNKLVAEHFMQKEKLAYGAVLCIDELDSVIPQHIFNSRPYDIIEFFRYSRQIGNFKISVTNQDQKGNVIYVKRVSAKIRHLLSQKPVLKPKFGWWLYNFVDKRIRHMTKFKTNFMEIWKKILKNMGFRKFEYYDEIRGQGVTKIKHCLKNPSLNIDYDDRSFRNIYKCKDKEIKPYKWTNPRPTQAELLEVLSPAMRELTKSNTQKRYEAKERTRALKLAEKQNKENVANV